MGSELRTADGTASPMDRSHLRMDADARRGWIGTELAAVGVNVWDLAALQPIVEEAGGRFSDSPLVLRQPKSGAMPISARMMMPIGAIQRL